MQTIPEKETRSGTEKEEELQKKDDRKEWTGSLRRSHRIVIINNESALVCNESCLIRFSDLMKNHPIIVAVLLSHTQHNENVG